MRYPLSLAAALFLACAAPAQTVKVPSEVKGAPSTFVRVPADTDCAEVQWYSPDDGLAVFPPELLKDSKTAVVTAAKPGRYRLVCYGAKDNRPSVPAVCVVVIGDAPPGPGPVPPGPADPLAAELQALYAAETNPDKAKHRAALVALYKQAVAVAAKPELATAGDLMQVLREASAALLPGDVLATIRARLGAEVVKVLPTEAKDALTPEVRQKAAQLFARIAAALEAVK